MNYIYNGNKLIICNIYNSPVKSILKAIIIVMI